MENAKALNVRQVKDKLSCTNQSSESLEIQNGEQEEDWAESSPTDSHHSDNKINQDDPSKEASIFAKHKQLKSQQPSLLGHGLFDVLSCPDKSCQIDASKAASQEFSAEEIMKIAGERFINSSTQSDENPNNHFDLSDKDAKKVELAELLFASADKVSNKQYTCADILLDRCDGSSSATGNAIERTVYYFSKALRERINRETGRVTLEDLDKLQFLSIDEEIMASTSIMLACHFGLPFFQAINFAGTQTITENVSGAKRIHVIDLAIKMGDNWAILMQALASQSTCPLELLKITAIGTTKKRLIEQTGKRLETFAQSLGIPFCFKLIMVSDRNELKENLFELDDGETIVVYSGYRLNHLISLPDRLDNVMKVLRNLNPNTMLVAEIEVNTCSPSFVDRFIEALFYFSAYFDCLEACMGNDPNRTSLESSYLATCIRNVVATNGDRRKCQTAKLDVWRAFFARFGMEEIKLSTTSLFQAEMVASKFACRSSCTFVMDGKSLLIGWESTPFFQVESD